MPNKYNMPQDLFAHIRDLQKRLEKLERRPRLAHSSIDSGVLNVGANARILIQGGLEVEQAEGLILPDGAISSNVVGSDGEAPASSPTLIAEQGLGFVYLHWTPVVNNDPVTYKLYADTTSGFTHGPGNMFATPTGASEIYRPIPADYAANYYFRLVASDVDGDALPSAEVSCMLGQVNSPDIAANTIQGNHLIFGQLIGAHLAANFLESGNIQTATSGRRVVITSTGIQLIEQDNSVLIDFPTNADEIASFFGALQTTSLLSLDNFEIRGTNNILAPGARLEISTGQYTASGPPTALVDYPVEDTDVVHEYYRTRSVDFGTTYDFLCRRFFNNVLVERTTLIGGAYDEWTPPFLAVAGLAVATHTAASEDRLHVIGEIVDGSGAGTGTWTLEQYDYTSWPPTQTQAFLWPHDSGVTYFQPNAGRDFTDADQFVTCEVLSNQQQFRFRRYSCTPTIAQVDQQDCTAPGISGQQLLDMSNKNIRGCAYGTFGLGLGNLFMVAMTDRVWFFNDSGVHSIPASFVTNGSQNAFAYSSVASKFRGYNNDDTQITNYTDWNNDSSFQTVQLWVAHTFPDTVGTTHNTPMSVQKTFQMKKRGQVTFGVPGGIPGDGGTDEPDSVRFYVGGPSATALARTAMWDQATQPAVGVTTHTYQTLRLASGGGAVNPPATSDYPNAGPGLVQDTSGTSLVIHPDGTILALAMHGGSATDNTNTTPPSTNSATYVALTGTVGPQTNPFFTIPYPPSGTVMIHIGADTQSQLAAHFAMTSFQIRDTNSVGTQRIAPSDDRCIWASGTDRLTTGRSFLITGLPTSGTMFVQMLHRTTNAGNIGLFRWRHITAEPRL